MADNPYQSPEIPPKPSLEIKIPWNTLWFSPTAQRWGNRAFWTAVLLGLAFMAALAVGRLVPWLRADTARWVQRHSSLQIAGTFVALMAVMYVAAYLCGYYRWRRTAADAFRTIAWRIDHEPHNADGYEWLGCLYCVVLRDNERGMAEFTRAILLNPGQRSAYSQRASARLDKRDYEGAVADATQAIALIMDSNEQVSWEFYATRAAALYELRELERMIADASQALTMLDEIEKPDEENRRWRLYLLYRRAEAFRKLGDRAQARIDRRLAHQLDPFRRGDPRRLWRFIREYAWLMLGSVAVLILTAIERRWLKS